MAEKLKQTQDARNSSVLISWFKRWVWASYANYDIIEKEMLRDKKPFSLLKYQKKYIGKPALILGAGISLEKALPLLKEWKGVIFTSESMASTVLYSGHKPEYICVFDGDDSIWKLFLKGYNWKGTTLITHPSVSPHVIRNWKWNKIYYTMMHVAHLHDENLWAKQETLKSKEALAKFQLLGSDFFENIMPTVYGFIGTAILNAGCVVNNAIETAHFMGYDPLFLIGVDFGHKDNIVRCPGWKREKNRWVHEEKKIIKSEKDLGREFMTSENGILTTEEQIEYKIALMSVYKLDRPQLIDCSDGIITELPKANIEEVIKNNGKGFEEKYRTDQEIVRIADTYLHSR